MLYWTCIFRSIDLVVDLVLDFRSLSKIANTYIAGLKPFLVTHRDAQAFCPALTPVPILGDDRSLRSSTLHLKLLCIETYPTMHLNLTYNLNLP